MVNPAGRDIKKWIGTSTKHVGIDDLKEDILILFEALAQLMDSQMQDIHRVLDIATSLGRQSVDPDSGTTSALQLPESYL